MDALRNFAASLVATAPSPATSGTSLVVTAGQGSYFPATPFDATIWPSGVQPTNTNAEIVRVTNVSTDTFTITRAQYGTTAQSIAVGYQIAQTVDANLLNQLAPLSGATFTGEVVAPDFKASGLTGATAASRYVGGTTNGAPVSGTFAVGDFIVDQTSTFWVCTTAGTPGTWWPLIEAHMVSRSATATAGPNEVTIFSGSTASQTISAIGSPVDGATWTIINRSSVAVTAGFGSSSMLPLGSTSSVTSLVVPVNGAYSFINYAGGQWYMTASNNLANSVGSTALATVSLTAQSAAQAATTLYTPASDGLFTINYYAKVTTAATTSSTLGVFSVISTDTDSNVVTSVGQSTQQNSLTTGFISGSITVYAKASTPIQYSLAYASSGATAMQYELRVVVAGTTAPSSTGTVSSFNGRTGAVTPGSSDYTAAQVGALPIATTVAAKNVLINGNMDIWQRGTTGFTTGYTADRWLIGGTQTVSQSTDVPYSGAKYSMDTVSTGANYNIIKQRIESFNSETLIAGTATISFWAKSLSGTNTLNVAFYYATAVDNFASQTYINTVGFGVPSTSWTFYSGQVTLPSAALSNGIEIQIYRDNSVANEFKLSQVQFENGSTATAFSRAGGTIQGELAACQRYYYQTSANASNTAIGSGWSTSSTGFTFNWQLPVPLRVAPSSVGSNSTSSGYYIYQGGAFINCNSISGILSSASYTNMALYVTTSGLTTGYGGMFFANSSSAYLYASAEL